MAMFLLDAQTKCLNQIFSIDVEQCGLPAVTYRNLTVFFEYILNELPAGLLLTGVGCEGYFGWQNHYEVGLADDGNYECLKMQKGAYSDAFTFMRLERISQGHGIVAKVKRIADNKVFKIPLVDLEAYDSHSHAARLIETYARWYRSQATITSDLPMEPSTSAYFAEAMA